VTLPFDFTSLVVALDLSASADITFLRDDGASQVIAGTVVQAGFAPLVLSPQWTFVPRVPKDQLERLPAGDRHRSGCLVWSIARDAGGASYDTLRTADMNTGLRADRIVDNDRGLTYVVTTAWTYGRQSLIAGAIGLLLDE
jgi:hypothetical protein